MHFKRDDHVGFSNLDCSEVCDGGSDSQTSQIVVEESSTWLPSINSSVDMSS